jgi:hypothetical protein
MNIIQPPLLHSEFCPPPAGHQQDQASTVGKGAKKETAEYRKGFFWQPKLARLWRPERLAGVES